MAVVWSSTFKTATVVISGAGLIATGPVAASFANGRSDTFVSAGQKIHYEGIMTGNDPVNCAIGYANSTWDPVSAPSFLGSDANSLGWYNNGQIFINNVQVGATVGTWVQGDVLAIEINFTSALIWFAVGANGWNNDILANQNPATNTGGTSLSTLAGDLAPTYSLLAPGGSTNGVINGRFLAASFTRAISSGYSAIDPGAGGDVLMAQVMM